MTSAFNSKIFGELIRQKRGKQSLRDLAEEIGVSSTIISRVENGKVSDLENFTRIFLWLGEDYNKYMSLPTNNDSTPSIQLRAAQNMSAEMANAFQELIKAAYAEIYAQTDAHDKA